MWKEIYIYIYILFVVCHHRPEAVAWLSRMEARGLQPDVDSYNSVIRTFPEKASKQLPRRFPNDNTGQ